jgi:hypothetical protein
MTDLWQDIQAKLKDLMGGWASYVALGSFLLYVLGYLAVRFHLTILGIGTDLAVLDERYVFTGAKFLVYLFSSLPIIVMLLLLVALPLALIDRLYSYLTKKKSGTSPNYRLAMVTKEWFSKPKRVAILGIAIAVILIQIVMRKCFLFSNVLLADCLPLSDIGLEQLLLDDDDGGRSLYFVGLVAGVAVTGLLWFYARKLASIGASDKFLIGLLAFLVLVQFLFLPVNYGVFIMDKSLPRVSDLGDQVALPENQKAWLVWEGTHGSTYLVMENAAAAATQKEPPAAPKPTTTPSQASSPTAEVTPAPTAIPPSPSVGPTAKPTVESLPSASVTISPSPSTSQPVNASTQNTCAWPDGTPTGIPGPVNIKRRLVTLPHKDLKRTEILGYDRVIKLIFVNRTL